MKRLVYLLVIVAICCQAPTLRAADYPNPSAMAEPIVAPSELNMDAATLDRIDALVEQGIADGDFPGGVVAVGRGNKIGFIRAYGDRQT